MKALICTAITKLIMRSMKKARLLITNEENEIQRNTSRLSSSQAVPPIVTLRPCHTFSACCLFGALFIWSGVLSGGRTEMAEEGIKMMKEMRVVKGRPWPSTLYPVEEMLEEVMDPLDSLRLLRCLCPLWVLLFPVLVSHHIWRNKNKGGLPYIWLYHPMRVENKYSSPADQTSRLCPEPTCSLSLRLASSARNKLEPEAAFVHSRIMPCDWAPLIRGLGRKVEVYDGTYNEGNGVLIPSGAFLNSYFRFSREPSLYLNEGKCGPQ